MKVVFTASKYGAKFLQGNYDEIVRLLLERGHEVFSPEIDSYDTFLNSKERKSLSELEKHAIYIKKVVEKADAIVIENTYGGFVLGYEASFALSMYKPVLGLSYNSQEPLTINDERYYQVEYKMENLAFCIDEFLDKVKKHHIAIRANFMLYPQHVNLLSQYSKIHFKSKSQVLRELISKLPI